MVNKTKIVAWIHRTAWGFIQWTFECGKSTAGLQRNWRSCAEPGLWKCFDFATSPSFPNSRPYSFWMWFFMKILFDGKQKTKCSMDSRAHWWWLHSLDIWMWSIDCWTGNKLKFMKDLKSCIHMVRCIFLWIWLTWWLSLHYKKKKK